MPGTKGQQRSHNQQDEELQNFVYSVSHDLQAPLRHISGFLNLLKSAHINDLNEEGQEFVEISISSANKLQAMLDALLVFSRVASDKPEFTAVDLNACLDMVRRDRPSDAETPELICEALPSVWGSSDQLQMLFERLLENVKDHNENSGDLNVFVSARQENDTAFISIRDNGVGIPEAHQQRVFNMFQTYGAGKETHVGAGLTIAQRIAKLHGGSLNHSAGDGSGGQFLLTLKLMI